jgi:kynurenine 3-monooxygenase
MVFSEYEKSRKPNADAIARMSYRNFLEMSSKRQMINFLQKKKIRKVFSDIGIY